MNKALFIIGIIVTIAVMCAHISSLKHIEAGTKPGKCGSLIGKLAAELSMILFAVGIADLSGLIDFGRYNGTFGLMGMACGGGVLLRIMSKRRTSPLYCFAAKAVLVVSVLELTLFNASSYRLWFGDYPEVTVSAKDIYLEDSVTYDEENDALMIENGDEGVMSFGYFKMPVGTVFADVLFEGSTKGADMVLDIKDDTQSAYYRYDISKDMTVKGKWRSQFIDCQFTGSVTEMRLKITPLNSGSVSVRSVTFNADIPVVVNWYRVLLLIAAACLVFAVMNCVTMQREVGENKIFVRNATVYVTIAACFIAFIIANRALDGKTWSDVFKDVGGNQVTRELVEAFEDGRTNIEFEGTTDPIAELQNPYDRNARETALRQYSTELGEDGTAPEVAYVWDHVYYGGKYYSYYGIAPVVLLFLPYHLITGKYFPDMPAVLLFSIIGIIGLSMLFSTFVKKLFPRLPTGIYVVSLIMMQTVSGIWFSIGRPDFYENAIASGFAFITWGVYLLFDSNLIGTGKISLPRVTVGSLLMAIAVLCRPTLVLYCICAGMFIVLSTPRMSGKVNKNGKPAIFTKQSVKYLICALLPMFVIGGVQMAYNYARFENPFEFGIQYSLTINDFTRAQFHSKLSWIAIYNYFFNTPVFSPMYPVISTNFQDLGVNGFFYNDLEATYNTSGLFFIALPMFAYFFSGKALRTLPDRRTKVLRAAYIALPCLIIPFAIVFSVWESGYAVRYMADFSWEAVIGAFTIIFTLVCRNNDPSKRNIAKALLCFACLWALLVSGVQSLNQAFRFAQFHKDFPEIAYMIENTFAFWK